jgi:hypothetical protein
MLIASDIVQQCGHPRIAEKFFVTEDLIATLAIRLIECAVELLVEVMRLIRPITINGCVEMYVPSRYTRLG